MFSSYSKKTAVREILPKATIVQQKELQNTVNPMTKSGEKRKPRKKATLPLASSIPYRKKKITGALREAVWIKTLGKTFEGKCPVTWCSNTITVFDFQSGHNIPESKGGETKLPNLIAICSRCNFSMGNTYTIDEWNVLHSNSPMILPDVNASKPPSIITEPKSTQEIQEQKPRYSFWKRLFVCFYHPRVST